MVKRGAKFPEEELAGGPDSPGVVEDNEVLERKLPPGNMETSKGEIPREAFTRRDLKWTEECGGASVDRSRHALRGIAGRRGMRNTITAVAGDIRNQTDAPNSWESRARLNSARAARQERDRLIEIWRGAIIALRELKKNDPSGEPALKLAQEIGIEIHWKSGRDGGHKRVIQISSVSEAVQAFVAAGIVTPEKAAEEQRRYEAEILEPEIEVEQCTDYGTGPTW